jgi:endonuclease/exonuclease/phosphatase family metal-dependent hydrolase
MDLSALLPLRALRATTLLLLSVCAITACSGTAPRARTTAPGELAVLSWNMEWLADPAALEAADFWRRCADAGHSNRKLQDDLPFCDVFAKRGIETAADYAARKLAPLRKRLAELVDVRGIDVIAVQEVQNAAALRSVLPAGYRIACFTTRVDAQNVGYAVRDALAASVTCREVESLSLEEDPWTDRPLRRGLALEIAMHDTRVTLLGLHLKSGCPGGPMDSPNRAACRSLQQQAAPLEAWIETQARAGGPFMILGDWNRDLEAEIRGGYPARSDGSAPRTTVVADQVRNLWPEINDGDPPESAMTLVAMDRTAAANRACHRNLDQIAVSATLIARLNPASLEEGRLPARFETRPVAASDHCPMSTRLVFGPGVAPL